MYKSNGVTGDPASYFAEEDTVCSFYFLTSSVLTGVHICNEKKCSNLTRFV